MSRNLGIIEIGSNNTKTHVYDGNKVVYEDNKTIEFKKNYKKENKIEQSDLDALYEVIKNAKDKTDDLHIYGCSIFRNITEDELNTINKDLKDKLNVEIEVVSQEDEAKFTALGCYKNIDYDKEMCIFIGGGGSTELIFVKNKEIVDKKYFNFGVVDITGEYPTLKEDITTTPFDEIYNYVDRLVGEINNKADVLVLAGGDHPYWYKNAQYKLEKNNLYKHDKQVSMLKIEKSDKYDRDCLNKSLEEIKQRSDNPLWFDGARAMKIITNVISHKIDAKYIIPTKINMEDGLKDYLS